MSQHEDALDPFRRTCQRPQAPPAWPSEKEWRQIVKDDGDRYFAAMVAGKPDPGPTYELRAAQRAIYAQPHLAYLDHFT